MRNRLGRHRRRSLRRLVYHHGHQEHGFSIIETAVALGVIFSVVLGLLASLNTGVRGLLTGRQRSAAIAVGKEIIEKARAVPYRDVGHDVNGDTTLASDPLVSGTAPAYTYTPVGGSGAEPLVATVSPSFPTHTWTETRDGGTFDITVYVTLVDNLVGDDHKRLTVFVWYDPAQYDQTAVPNVVGLSTFVSVGGQSPIDYLTIPGAPGTPGTTTTTSAGTTTTTCPGCPAVPPYLAGDATFADGKVLVTGTLSGVALSEAVLAIPEAHGSVSGRLSKEGRGNAMSAWGRLALTSGTPSGGVVDGGTATCEGARATTAADNDGGLPAPDQDVDPDTGYASSAACSTSASGSGVAADGSVGVSLGATDQVRSETSVASCTACSPAVGDGDGLMWGWNRAAASDTSSMPFDVGIVSGTLMSGSFGPTLTTIDHDAGPLLVSTSRLQSGAVQMVTIDGAPLTCPSVVSIGAVDVTATAAVGATAVAPSVSSGGFDVTVCNTVLGSLVQEVVTIVPGQTVQKIASATFDVVDVLSGTTAAVTVDTTISTQPATTTCGSSNPTCASPIMYAEARLTNWLVVTSRLRIVQSSTTIADLTVEFSYGTVRAKAEHMP